MNGHAIPLGLLAISLHLLAIPSSLPAIFAHGLAIPLNLLVIPLNLLAIPSNLPAVFAYGLAIPLNRLAIPLNLLAIPLNLLTVFAHGRVIPLSLLAVFARGLASPWNRLAIPFNLLAIPFNRHAIPLNGHAVFAHGTPRPGQVEIRQEVILSQLPCWKHLTPEVYRARIADLLHQIEATAASERLKRGVGLLGVEKILAQDPETRPEILDGSPAPFVHAATRKIRKELRDAYGWFVAAYREAADKLRKGDRNAAFPPGSFPPHLPFVPA